MSVFRLTAQSIERLPDTTFADRGVKERADLQRLLKANISVVVEDVLIISEEFAEWDDSKRRIDLLAVDRDANLVVIELKRDNEGGHMELQAIRYAAMVSSMKFDRAVEVFQEFLDRQVRGQTARGKLLEFLGWDEPQEKEFGNEVRIVLIAADFSKELTTSVLWLNDRGLDIRCVRVIPYANGEQTIVEVQPIVPLPEAETYMVRVREKLSAARESGEDTGYWFMNTGDDGSNHRSWEDCRKYGFMIAGGGQRWIDAIQKLRDGDKLFAYLSGYGYVGFGEVTAEAVPLKDFVPPGENKKLLELPMTARPRTERLDDADQYDWCVKVRWIHTVDRQQGVLRSKSRRSTLERIRRQELVDDLLKHFGTPSGTD